MMQAVPVISIVFMFITLIISIGLPVALCVLFRKKLHGKLLPVLIGAVTFVLFALVLESGAHRLILGSAVGGAIQGSTVLLALYGGIMAALFEEGGRFIAMKLGMKKTLSRENALMYGVGHGGIEAVVIVGLSYISNIAASFMINSGSLTAALSALDAAAAEAAVQQVSALWTTEPYLFLMSGVERLSAIALHLGMSYLVYRAVKYGEKRFFFISFGVHFAVDAAAVLMSAAAPTIVLELVMLAAAAALTYAVCRLYRREPELHPADAAEN